MDTGTLFDTAAPQAVAPPPRSFALRPYQIECVNAIGESWAAGNKAVLIVQATGTGKTEVFANVIGRYSKRRALVLAHRQELVDQAAKRIRQRTGKIVSIERGENWAPRRGDRDVVCATVQSLVAGQGDAKRMARFDREHFDVVIIDEAHHAVASSYRKILEHFAHDGAKVLGVTATPDRADEEALGRVFEAVAYEYDLRRAIGDGWLCPVKQTCVEVSGLDLSSVHTTAGDLNQEELASIVEEEKMLHAFASPTFNLAGARKTLVYTVTVKQGERFAEILNRWDSGCARFVCGSTPEHERNETFGDFGRGAFRFLVNVGIATEGWDDPSIDHPIQVIAMCRPTKSRSLYAQCVGRATRPVPGLVDAQPTDALRRLAIAGSVKPYAEVLDFVGNAGRHKLVTVTDILCDDLEEAEREELSRRVKEKAKREPTNPEAELDVMRREAEERRRAEIAKRSGLRIAAAYSTGEIDPFDLLDIKPIRERAWHRGRPISDKQRAMLTKYNIDAEKVNYTNAQRIIGEIIKRDMPTPKQVKTLARFGMYAEGMTFKQASAAIDRLAKNGWKRVESA